MGKLGLDLYLSHLQHSRAAPNVRGGFKIRKAPLNCNIIASYDRITHDLYCVVQIPLQNERKITRPPNSVHARPSGNPCASKVIR